VKPSPHAPRCHTLRDRCERAPARAGVTLLELILVMFILAVAVGGGLGMFAALDLGKNQAASLVKNTLRAAQNTAIATQAPARVRIDREKGQLWPETLRPVGTWHFEKKRLQGGNDLLGTANPELFVPDGYIGDAISFTDRMGESAEIPVDLDPAFDFTDGFVVECVIRQEGVGGGKLLSIADHVKLELGQGGILRGSFRARVDKTTGNVTSATRGGTPSVLSGPGVVSPERWTRVRLSYDRQELALFVDGVRVATRPETVQVWKIDGPLVLSDERRPFPGSVDNLVISAVLVDDPATLPETVQIVSAPAVIRFTPGGGLDRREHTAPPEIVLGFEDGSREIVGVGFYGTVE